MKTISYFRPEKVLVVFDSELGSFRQQMDSNYNANRFKDWSSLSDDMNPFTQLSGLKSDNILGIPGIGIKTAQKLFNGYGNLNSIYHNITDVTNERIKRKLLDYKEDVLLNLKLIKLNRKVNLTYDLEELNLSKDFKQYKTMQILKDVGIA
ncbi:5'-3' exonuclease H3TH domain-containing protein [Dethiothermospora halolimnae]|uniref:5'-3' exonuclease H3TH domain-containing protein n=1 Tax=Dethiothermospora halolimnae TaxID=3114390 RepID=UPI003CCB9083